MAQLLAVNQALLFFAWKTVTEHKWNFRTVQANPFGAALNPAHHINHQAGIHVQFHRNTVRRDGIFSFVLFQIFGELLFFFLNLFIAGAQAARRVNENTALVRIDNHLDIIKGIDRQFSDANDCWNAKRPRYNHHMRIHCAFSGDNGGDLIDRQFHQRGRRNFIANQDAFIGNFAVAGIGFLQEG